MDQQYFNDLEELFRTQGWQRLVRDAEEAIRQREASALYARSYDEVCYLRGEAAQLATIVNLESSIATLRAELEGGDE